MKRSSRTQALAMIMVLLPVHVRGDRVLAPPEPAGNWKNGDRPSEEADLVPNLREVRELRFRAEKAVTVIVMNMTLELWKILQLLREIYENYYL